ncbi:Uncharacterised protein [Mycobacteroides abscessus subsp. abscessus]|nr:Uncharacterised protein [Mycobacteroides abscessus subsp. abscessus]
MNSSVTWCNATSVTSSLRELMRVSSRSNGPSKFASLSRKPPDSPPDSPSPSACAFAGTGSCGSGTVGGAGSVAALTGRTGG